VAPALTNVHVPVHVPPRLSVEDSGPVGDFPHAESARLQAKKSASALFIG
jgi:hypothetical protein